MNVDKEVEELKTEIKRLGKKEADGTFTVGIQGRVWCLPLLSSSHMQLPQEPLKLHRWKQRRVRRAPSANKVHQNAARPLRFHYLQLTSPNANPMRLRCHNIFLRYLSVNLCCPHQSTLPLNEPFSAVRVIWYWRLKLLAVDIFRMC